VALCSILPYVVSAEFFPVPDTGVVAPVQQLCKVTLIVFAGVGRETAFRLQMVQKGVDPFL
jgi:hypothetical protein